MRREAAVASAAVIECERHEPAAGSAGPDGNGREPIAEAALPGVIPCLGNVGNGTPTESSDGRA